MINPMERIEYKRQALIAEIERMLKPFMGNSGSVSVLINIHNGPGETLGGFAKAAGWKYIEETPMKKKTANKKPLRLSCLCPLEAMPVEAHFDFNEILKDFAEGRIAAPADGSQHESLEQFFRMYGGEEEITGLYTSKGIKPMNVKPCDPRPKATERFFNNCEFIKLVNEYLGN